MKRWVQTMLWTGLALLLAAEPIDDLKTSHRQLAHLASSWWTRLERQERRPSTTRPAVAPTTSSTSLTRRARSSSTGPANQRKPETPIRPLRIHGTLRPRPAGSVIPKG